MSSSSSSSNGNGSSNSSNSGDCTTVCRNRVARKGHCTKPQIQIVEEVPVCPECPLYKCIIVQTFPNSSGNDTGKAPPQPPSPGLPVPLPGPGAGPGSGAAAAAIAAQKQTMYAEARARRDIVIGLVAGVTGALLVFLCAYLGVRTHRNRKLRQRLEQQREEQLRMQMIDSMKPLSQKQTQPQSQSQSRDTQSQQQPRLENEDSNVSSSSTGGVVLRPDQLAVLCNDPLAAQQLYAYHGGQQQQHHQQQQIILTPGSIGVPVHLAMPLHSMMLVMPTPLITPIAPFASSSHQMAIGGSDTSTILPLSSLSPSVRNRSSTSLSTHNNNNDNNGHDGDTNDDERYRDVNNDVRFTADDEHPQLTAMRTGNGPQNPLRIYDPRYHMGVSEIDGVDHHHPVDTYGQVHQGLPGNSEAALFYRSETETDSSCLSTSTVQILSPKTTRTC